jgi:transposase
MRIIGCDLHSRQQTLAMLDTETGEVKECVLHHQGDEVRRFYTGLPGPVRVGIEATGSMQWFLKLMEELGVECLVGHPAKIRAYEPRKQKNDRRDALLLLELLEDERFPTIWMPSIEQRDVRALLRHRHLWVRMRVRIQNALQALALSHAIRRGAGLWSEDGQYSLLELKLPPFMGDRRDELMVLYRQLQADIEVLDARVAETAEKRPLSRMLMTHPGVGPNTALATEVYLGDATRFADGKAVSSYVGMIPKENSSGKHQRMGELTKQGNAMLRYLWCEAARHAVRRDPELKRFYTRKLAQKGMGKAAVAAGRKLGVRLWIMLRDEIDYEEFCRRGKRQHGEAHVERPDR